MKTAAKDDPEQVWKDLFEGSVGTDDPCQRTWMLKLERAELSFVRRRELLRLVTLKHNKHIPYLDNDIVDHPRSRS
jgi:hypothetical protein